MKIHRKITSIILIVLGCINTGIFLIFSLLGKLACGNFFKIVNGADGPIPTCKNIFNTDFVFALILGIVLLVIGSTLLFVQRGMIYEDKNKKSITK